MAEETQGVKPEVSESPSDTEGVKSQADSSPESEKKTQDTVPYERFKQVQEQNKLLEELLATRAIESDTEIKSQAKRQSDEQSYGQDPQAQARAWMDYIKNESTESARSAIKAVRDEFELKELVKSNPDFPIYKEFIKEFRAKNPESSFEDAYLLAKAKSGAFSKTSAPADADIPPVGKQAAPKKEVSFDPTKAIHEKTPDGKFRYSLEELASLLSKK